MHAVATLDTGALRAILRLFVLMHLLYLVLNLLDAHLVLSRLWVYFPLVGVVQEELLLVEYGDMLGLVLSFFPSVAELEFGRIFHEGA